MSVLIKGMKMPKDCIGCPFDDEDYYRCNAIMRENYNRKGRPDYCPLVELQTPHGRLIDADELIKEAGQYWDEHMVGFYGVGTGNILRAPTVIEGEE